MVERANIVTHVMSMNVLEFVPSVPVFRKYATIEFEAFIKADGRHDMAACTSLKKHVIHDKYYIQYWRCRASLQ